MFYFTDLMVNKPTNLINIYFMLNCYAERTFRLAFIVNYRIKINDTFSVENSTCFNFVYYLYGRKPKTLIHIRRIAFSDIYGGISW